MTALRIGRADLIHNTAEWIADGNEVRLSGRIPTKDITYAKAIRQQLLGYAENPDEPVIAVTWADDPTVDGFYKVDSVSVGVEPGLLKIGWFPYELAMTRVPQYALPMQESMFVGALRTNAAGIIAGTDIPWTALPQGARNAAVIGGAGVGAFTSYTRTGADGTIHVSNTTTVMDHNCRVQCQIPPGDLYDSAALLEIGSTLRAVVGRQIPQNYTNWRLSNGLIRVTPVISGSSMRLSISAYNGTQWETAIDFKIVTGAAATEVPNTSPVGLTVLRNSPEIVILRVVSTNLTVPWQGGILDLALRRGARLLYGIYHNVVVDKFGIIPATAVAATTLTGGLRKTTNDGGGNRFVISSPDTITKDLATGEVYLTANGARFNFAVGFEVPGATATVGDTAQDLIYEYMAADTERVSVVGR